MTNSSFDVLEVVAMQLIGADASVLPVTTELGFRTADPYTVRAVFRGAQSTSTWLIGRELLDEGVHASAEEPAGSGDISRPGDPDTDCRMVAGIALGVGEALDSVAHHESHRAGVEVRPHAFGSQFALD